MSASSPSSLAALRAPEDLSVQLNACEVILSMWAGDNLDLDEHTSTAITNLGRYLALPVAQLGGPASIELKDSLPAAITFTLPVQADHGEGGSSKRTLHLDVSLSLRKTPNSSLRPQVQLRRSEWLTRTEYDKLAAIVQETALSGTTGDEDDEGPDAASTVLAVVEALSEALIELTEAPAPSLPNRDDDTAAPLTSRSTLVVRTWYHFPSLSSKEKRNDLVMYAMHHEPPLTGFILAGKPGLAVLEAPLPDQINDESKAGSSHVTAATAAIDRYWSRIKSSSWADIPAAHKKVSLRLTETQVSRAFTDMQDVTDIDALAGGQTVRAHRPNRNDLAYLERWLESRQLGGRLEGLLGADWR